MELTTASKLAKSSIFSIDTVKCFNGQHFEQQQYARTVKKAANFYLRQVHYNALQIAFVRFTIVAMFVQGFWYGNHLVASGKKSAGDVMTAFWSCLMATQAVQDILPYLIVLEKGRAAGASLEGAFNRMENGRKVTNMSGQLAPMYCDGDVEIRNVC